MEAMLEKKSTLATLRRDLKIYPQLLVNVRVSDKEAALNDANVQAAAKKVEDALGDGGRLLLRTSGTEPLVRVMVEADSHELCEKYVKMITDELEKVE